MEGNRRQHTRTEQEPDIPWHLHTRCIRDRIACKCNEKIEFRDKLKVCLTLTLLPASLLCKFISPVMLVLLSCESMNFLENITP